MVKKKPLQGSDKVSVTFETPPRPDARSVALAGDFNRWDPAATPMKQRKDGCWSATLRLPRNREFGYRFVVDGQQWVTDDHADRTEPNEHGETNGIVVVR
ncbi:MAG TPA: isoamylase early set domain-containing protein [Chloroflexota bacterium]|nr:isoamylase early set domain-containing protein [Chloroflexota bacterium]